uniref:Ribosomal protein S8 n=1 Tax=Tsukubamonas globosa TaxID=875863 RepID=W8VY32_9EUKA|nr:ribosomal protein S8 [Tsukubamonas globosa]BAO51957.1 ribosomal protein S8 [Tsukubamonas globosa]
MITQDSLSLLLTKIRNGFKYRNHYIIHQNTKINKDVVQLLYLHGFLRGYRLLNNNLYIYPKFNDVNPVLRSIKRVSRPGFKKYITVAALKELQISQPNFIVVSTVNGIMSHDSAIQQNLGGEFLFIVS